jgi:hypothetical protein
MPINKTYRAWIQRICELRPKQLKQWHWFFILRQKDNTGCGLMKELVGNDWIGL